MPIGSYIKPNKASILYVLDVLIERSSPQHPLSILQIQKILKEYPYDMSLDRGTISELLKELAACYDELIMCETSEQTGRSGGYSYGWYYNSSSSAYKDIENIIYDLYYNPMVPSESGKQQAEKLLSLLPRNNLLSTSEISSLDQIQRKESRIDEEGYQLLTQFRHIIKENLSNPNKEIYVSFYVDKYVVDNKKIKRVHYSNKKGDFLPLVIVEVDYKYWVICYKDNKDYLYHYRIDLLSELELVEKAKTRNNHKRKLINKVNSSDNLKKYLEEHRNNFFSADCCYFPELYLDDKVINVELKVYNDILSGITNIVDEFGKDIKIIETNEEYTLIKIKAAYYSIIDLVEKYSGDLYVQSPEDLRLSIGNRLSSKSEKLGKLANDYPKMPKPKKREYKLFSKLKTNVEYNVLQINFIWNGVISVKGKKPRDNYKEDFYNYLQDNGFVREMISEPYGKYKEEYGWVTSQYKLDEIIKLLENYPDKKLQVSYDIYQCINQDGILNKVGSGSVNTKK